MASKDEAYSVAEMVKRQLGAAIIMLEDDQEQKVYWRLNEDGNEVIGITIDKEYAKENGFVRVDRKILYRLYPETERLLRDGDE